MKDELAKLQKSTQMTPLIFCKIKQLLKCIPHASQFNSVIESIESCMRDGEDYTNVSISKDYILEKQELTKKLPGFYFTINFGLLSNERFRVGNTRISWSIYDNNIYL